EAGHRLLSYGVGRRRIGIDIDEAAVDLAISRSSVDRSNRLVEGTVVEDGAINEAGSRRIDIGTDVALEIPENKIVAVGPRFATLGNEFLHLGDLRRREGARE